MLWIALLAIAHAAVPADEVTSLPGWDGPFPSKQYSGYLNIAGGKHLHYWLVFSENNPTTDPLVMWFNGGPGCSSLDGYFYEHGPFHVVEPIPATGTPLLYRNPYAWSTLYNVLYLEAPACVGFSYSDNPATGCRNSDTQQAVDNFNALQQFYTSYPEYAKSDLYITGESYAGMYVPTLALQVIQYNNQSANKIPLKGIAVGNGVIGENTGQNSEQIKVDYLYGHGLFSEVLYAKMMVDCGNFTNISPACNQDLTEMSREVGNVNIYDIYDVCINDYAPDPEKQLWRRPADMVDIKMSQLGGPVACIDGYAAEQYLNQAAVRTAIHVQSQAQIGQWVICGGNLSYSENWGSLLPNYKNTIIPNTRVLIFNGDADCCVPYNGNEQWTSTLGIPQTKAWTPWSVNSQVAGYVTSYQMNFQFVTVKGAGHMVPQYKPVEALNMIERFVQNKCC